MGVRASEMPIARPLSDALLNGEASLTLPVVRNKRRRMFRRLPFGAVPRYGPICVDSNDPDTVNCGYQQRLMRNLPKAKTGVLKRFREFVRGWLRNNLPKAEVMSFYEWLDSTTYDTNRKQQLTDAWNDLQGGRPTTRQCQHVDSFVKSEFYETWKHARLINSRCDAFKAWSGPLFKSIEKVLYEDKHFIKHVPVALRPKVILAMKQAGLHYYQTDFTAFESHFTPELLDACECELYQYCLDYSSDSAFLCSVIKGTNKMRTRTGVRATVRGRRMSGDMCTSLGNGFTNLMLALFIVHEKGGYLEGVVEGDDGLFSSSVPLTTQDYLDLGFTIKIDEISDPCRGSFCGMVFSESMEIIRNPRKVFQGFGWTQSFINGGTLLMRQLLRAKALSTVYETPQCPIVGVLAREALRQTRGVLPRFVNDGYHMAHDEEPLPEFSPSHDTRVLFSELYGIDVSTQLACEDLIRRGDLNGLSMLVPPTSEQLSYATDFIEVG